MSILEIPHPDWRQIIIGAQLLVYLYPIRMLLHWLDNASRKERNLIIRAHVKSGHKSRLKLCYEGDCPKLKATQNLVRPGLETPAELVEIDPY